MESQRAVWPQRAGSRQSMAERGDAGHRFSRRDRQSINENNHKRWSTESTTSMNSLLDGHKGGPFHWQMPFTVKCIGTFRLGQCLSLYSISFVFVPLFYLFLVHVHLPHACSPSPFPVVASLFPPSLPVSVPPLFISSFILFHPFFSFLCLFSLSSS